MENGNQYLMEKTEFTTDRWTQHTDDVLQNDSVANRHMYKHGYWWTNSWATTDTVTGKTYDQIQQFDKYFFRLSFRYPGRTYYIDDISLYKSNIGGAEFNGDVLRVDFGYQTNLADLAKKDPTGAIELPGEYFRLVSHPTMEMRTSVLSAEYHADGYLYLADNAEFYIKTTPVSAHNPLTTPSLPEIYRHSLPQVTVLLGWSDRWFPIRALQS